MRGNIRTNILFLILFFSTTILHGQVKDVNLITGSWNQGVLDDSNKVINPGQRRGGASSITFNKDNSLIYRGAFTCGFGAERKGTWSLNIPKKTMTFNYSEIIGYLNNREAKLGTETEVYQIKRLNSLELILTGSRNDNPIELYFWRKWE